MTTVIHSTAIVDPTADLAHDVTVEPFAIIGPEVQIGAETTIGARATIERGTIIDSGCSVGIGCVLGGAPQDFRYAEEPTSLEIGSGTVLREYVTIHRGTVRSGATTLGRNCYIMAYAHVAHDCHLGDNVILGNAVQLAGHVEIDDHAQVSGLTPVHQFVRIGRHAFVGGGSRVPQDVAPYALVAGNPLRTYGINTEGLRRAGLSSETRAAIKRAFRLLFNSRIPRDQAIAQIDREFADVDEIMHLLAFVTQSSRGVLT
jgi:UDP-N-acetylglucosamine acyltransferase